MLLRLELGVGLGVGLRVGLGLGVGLRLRLGLWLGLGAVGESCHWDTQANASPPPPHSGGCHAGNTP